MTSITTDEPIAAQVDVDNRREIGVFAAIAEAFDQMKTDEEEFVERLLQLIPVEALIKAFSTNTAIGDEGADIVEAIKRRFMERLAPFMERAGQRARRAGEIVHAAVEQL